jgi:hypothetical protein
MARIPGLDRQSQGVKGEAMDDELKRRRVIFIWEAWGILFLVLIGSGWHFLFDALGRVSWIGAIAPVNESPWEHLKLVLFPVLLWALIEAPSLARRPNFLPAKALSILVGQLFILGFFYTYLSILGHSWLPLDILSFVLAVTLGQWASYRLLLAKPLAMGWCGAGGVVLLLLIVIFILCTYYPPHLSILQDSRNGTYGILTP